MRRSLRLGLVLLGVAGFVATACTTPGGGGGGVTNLPPTAVIQATPTSGSAPLSVDLRRLAVGRPRRPDLQLRLGLRRRWIRHRRDAHLRVQHRGHLDRDPDGHRRRRGHGADHRGHHRGCQRASHRGCLGHAHQRLGAVVGELHRVGFLRQRDGTIVSHSWDFGDGNSSTSADPTHTYAGDGVYVAELTVTDNGGATDTDSVTITGGRRQRR